MATICEPGFEQPPSNWYVEKPRRMDVRYEVKEFFSANNLHTQTIQWIQMDRHKIEMILLMVQKSCTT